MGDARVSWNKIVTVEDIDPSLLDSFSCGNEQMDNWFLTKALSWCYLGFCQVYIALGSDGVVGFFSLSPTSVRPVELTRSQRHGKNSMEHPGILLGRIAVREDIQKSGQRAGSLLLDEAIRRAFSIGTLIVLSSRIPGPKGQRAQDDSSHERRSVAAGGIRSSLVARRGHGRQCAPHWMRADAGHIYGVSM